MLQPQDAVRAIAILDMHTAILLLLLQSNTQHRIHASIDLSVAADIITICHSENNTIGPMPETAPGFLRRYESTAFDYELFPPPQRQCRILRAERHERDDTQLLTLSLAGQSPASGMILNVQGNSMTCTADLEPVEFQFPAFFEDLEPTFDNGHPWFVPPEAIASMLRPMGRFKYAPTARQFDRDMIGTTSESELGELELTRSPVPDPLIDDLSGLCTARIISRNGGILFVSFDGILHSTATVEVMNGIVSGPLDTYYGNETQDLTMIVQTAGTYEWSLAKEPLKAASAKASVVIMEESSVELAKFPGSRVLRERLWSGEAEFRYTRSQ